MTYSGTTVSRDVVEWEAFGNACAACMDRRGLCVADLAYEAGVSAHVMLAAINLRRGMSTGNFLILCRFLGISPLEFLKPGANTFRQRSRYHKSRSRADAHANA